MRSVRAAVHALLVSAACALPDGGAPLKDSKISPPASTTVDSVGMQCVSEFNWNQGEGDTYKSATGYFVGSRGNIVTNDVPDCAGGWSATNDTLVLKGTKQPRMFMKDAAGKLIMLDMKSEEISWTQNVGQLGRQFNGALYTTWVRPEDESNPANAARLCRHNGAQTPRLAHAPYSLPTRSPFEFFGGQIVTQTTVLGTICGAPRWIWASQTSAASGQPHTR